MGPATLAICMLVIGFAGGIALTGASVPVREKGSSSPTNEISSTDSPKSTTNVAEIVAKAREQLSFYGITDEDIYRDLLALRIFELVHREVDPLQTRPAGAVGVTQLGDPEVILQAGAGLCQSAVIALAAAFREAGIPHQEVSPWRRNGESHIGISWLRSSGTPAWLDPSFGVCLIGNLELEPWHQIEVSDLLSLGEWRTLEQRRHGVLRNEMSGLPYLAATYIQWFEEFTAREGDHAATRDLFLRDPTELPAPLMITYHDQWPPESGVTGPIVPPEHQGPTNAE